jgi:hypothetical protein
MNFTSKVFPVLTIVLVFFGMVGTEQCSVPTGFEIYSSNQKLAKEVKSILESSYKDLSYSLDESLTYPITVYVADSEKDFKSQTGGNFPDWGIGYAVFEHNLIVIKSPDHFRYNKSLGQLLSHELAHLFLEKKAGGKDLPRWMEEGFAMQKSHEWQIGQDLSVVRALFTRSIFPLSGIEGLNSFPESKAQLSYTLSFLAISYFFKEYGERTLADLVNYISQGKTWDDAFMLTTGSDYAGFQNEFSDYIKKRYQFISFFGDTFLLWLGLAFVIILLYFMKKRSTKKILERWELEDRGIIKGEKEDTT